MTFMKNIINKYKFLLFLLQLFTKENFKTKLYIILRILIFPWIFLKSINRYINKEDTILDLWCWYWIVSLYLQFSWLNNQILGLDIDEKRINNLQTVCKQQWFTELHFKKRDFITEWFNWLEWYNTAILVDFLHHLDLKTQIDFLHHLWKSISTLIIKDIDIKPKYKYYWNRFHDRVLMQNKILCFQWSKKTQKLLTDIWYTVTYKKIPSIFPYPHYLLIAKK